MMRRALLASELFLWRWLVPAMVFLLPWNARLIWHQAVFAGQTVDGATLSFSAIEGLVWLAIFLAGLLAIGGGWSWRIPRSPARIFGALLLAWSAVSLAWSADAMIGAQALIRLAAALGLYALVWSHPNRMRLRNVFIASVSLQAILALVQVATQQVWPSTVLGTAWHVPWNGPASVVEYAGGRLLRAYGTLPHPNVLGGFLAVGCLLALTAERRGTWRYAYTTASALCAIGLVLTFSRSAWLAALVGAVAAGMSLAKRAGAWPFVLPRLLAAVSVSAVLVFLFLPFFTARVTATGRLESRSISERVSSLANAAELIAQHPTRGLGLGQTVPALLRAGRAPEPPHAVALVVLLELGMLGLFLCLATLAALVWRLRPTPLFLAIACTLLVISFLDHYLWTSVSGLFLAVFSLAVVSDETRHE